MGSKELQRSFYPCTSDEIIGDRRTEAEVTGTCRAGGRIFEVLGTGGTVVCLDRVCVSAPLPVLAE